MRFVLIVLIFALMAAVVSAKPRTREPNTQRETRAHPDKGKQKTRSNYIQLEKRTNPNADLLFLDQLIL